MFLRGHNWPDGDAVAYAFRLEDLARFAFSLAILVTYLSLVPAATAERVLGWGTRLRSRRWLKSGSTP